VEGDRVDAEKLDINRETLRVWVRRAEVDAGRRPGLTTGERARLKDLERENRELRRAKASISLVDPQVGEAGF
jgi:transposase